MSLVASIFGPKGSKSKDGGESLTGLFETPTAATESTASSSSLHSLSRRDTKRRNEDVVPRTTSLEPALPTPKGGADDAVVEAPEETSETPSPGSQQGNVDERTVFVGNLPLGTTRKALHHFFALSCAEKIVSARIRGVPVQGVKVSKERAGDQKLVKKVCVNTNLVDTSKASSCLGYVVFATRDGVEQALALNNAPFPDPATSSGATTRHIRVDRVNPTHDAARSVFVGNLPYHTDEETLRRHVCQHCDLSETDVEGVRVVRNPDFQCRGFAYVLLAQKSLIPNALRSLPGTKYLGRELRVQVCGKRFKNHRGEAPARHRPKDKKKAGGGGATDDEAERNPTGALRRILGAEKTKKRRPRGPDNNKKVTAHKSGVSKRAAAEAKVGKRVKKIQKRISKGMGKTKSK